VIVAVCPPVPVPDKDEAAGENLRLPDESPPVPIADDDCAEDQNPPDPDQCPPIPDQNPSVPVVIVMASVCVCDCVESIFIACPT